MNNTNKIIGAVVALGMISLVGWYFLGNKSDVNIEKITIEKIINHEREDLKLGNNEVEKSNFSLKVKSTDGKNKGNFFNLKLDSIAKASIKNKKIDLALNFKIDALYKADGEMFKEDILVKDFPFKLMLSIADNKINFKLELDQDKLIAIIPDPQLKAMAGVTMPMYVNNAFFIDLKRAKSFGIEADIFDEIFNKKKAVEILDTIEKNKNAISLKYTGDTKDLEGKEVAKFGIDIDFKKIKKDIDVDNVRNEEDLDEIFEYLTKGLYFWVEENGNLLAIEFKLHTNTKALEKYNNEDIDKTLKKNGNFDINIEFNSINLEIDDFDIWTPENPINIMDMFGEDVSVSLN